MNNAQLFMQFAITYLENRTKLVEQKTNVLLVTTGILLTAYTFIIDRIFLKYISTQIYLFSYTIIFLAIVLLLGAIVMLFLLQSVRPSRYFLLGEVRKMDRDEPENYVMWPFDGFSDCQGKKFYERMADIDSDMITENYKYLHCLSLCFVRNKYEWYRRACNTLKLLIIICVLTICILYLLYFPHR